MPISEGFTPEQASRLIDRLIRGEPVYEVVTEVQEKVLVFTAYPFSSGWQEVQRWFGGGQPTLHCESIRQVETNLKNAAFNRIIFSAWPITNDDQASASPHVYI